MLTVKYTLDLSDYLNVLEGENAKKFLLLAEGELQTDPEQLLAETGVCEFSIFGRKFSIKVIDGGQFEAITSERMFKAYMLGRKFAQRVRIGRRFFGSAPIALKLYKQRNCAEYDSFLLGFHYALEDIEIFVSPNTGLVTGFHFKR